MTFEEGNLGSSRSQRRGKQLREALPAAVACEKHVLCCWRNGEKNQQLLGRGPEQRRGVSNYVRSLLAAAAFQNDGTSAYLENNITQVCTKLLCLRMLATTSDNFNP